MSQIAALLASRMWAAEPSALQAWAAAKESAAALSAAGMAPADRMRRAASGESTVHVERSGETATVHVSGVLLHAGPWWATMDGDATDYVDLRAEIAKLGADPGISAVRFHINSPGGDAVGLASTAAAIGALRAAGKSTSAHIAGMGTSAAYYLAAATDRITAEPDSLVGSIGTMTVLRDTTGLQDRIGIHLEVVSSGPEKGAGADGKITPAVRAQAQRRVDAFAAAFREHVGVGRKMTAESVAASATGDYWLAGEAKARGLIDDVADAPEIIAPPSPPAAAQATTTSPESAMDVKLKAKLAALCQSHPTEAAALVAEAMKDESSEASLQAFADAIAAKAENDRRNAEVADLKAKLAAAEKDRDEAKAEAAAAKAQAAHRAPDDVGSDPPRSEPMTREQFASLTPTERAEYVAKHGVDSIK